MRCSKCNTAKYHISCFTRYMLDKFADDEASIPCPCCRAEIGYNAAVDAEDELHECIIDNNTKIKVIMGFISYFN